MKKFVFCKLCLIVFGALVAMQTSSAGNWNNKNSAPKKSGDEQYTKIDRAGKGIQWRLATDEFDF